MGKQDSLAPVVARYLSEDRFIEELRELCEHADAEAEADKLELKAQLRLMDDKLTKMKGLSNGGKATGRAGGPGVGRMWEAMGRAWAEAGEFVDAIKAYR